MSTRGNAHELDGYRKAARAVLKNADPQVEERRVIVLPDGEEVTAPVSKVGPGIFQLQTAIPPFALLRNPDFSVGLGFGALLSVEESADGRLLLKKVLREESDDSLTWAGIDRRFVRSEQFRPIGDRIIQAGGNWEWAAGLLSVYMPPGTLSRHSFDVHAALSEALDDWQPEG